MLTAIKGKWRRNERNLHSSSSIKMKWVGAGACEFNSIISKAEINKDAAEFNFPKVDELGE